jgi:alpha-L-fucosidase
LGREKALMRRLRRCGRETLVIAAALCMALVLRSESHARGAHPGPYEPTWESVSQHPLPQWYADAKFGIIVHWGLYSVPAWALPRPAGNFHWPPVEDLDPEFFAHLPYSEWYLNSLRLPGSPTEQYHLETYGPLFDYLDFIPAFNQGAAKWRPDDWAELFASVGARYVLITSRHLDGFQLWPSAVTNPNRAPNQQHAERDIVSEFTAAIRARGMRVGFYKGGRDMGFQPLPVYDLLSFIAAVPETAEYEQYLLDEWRELIRLYRPSILWNDAGSPCVNDPFCLNVPALFADYYNRVPDGVVDNRWTPIFLIPHHADFLTEEYTAPSSILPKKWELVRAIGTSFGYNRNERSEDLATVKELVALLVDAVSKNGNMMLGVGPRVDGTIPEIQVQRLRGIGRWLDVNGEAIYGTTYWLTYGFDLPEGPSVRYTRKGTTLYAILLGRPRQGTIVLPDLILAPGAEIRLLGGTGPLRWEQVPGGVLIEVGDLPATDADAYTLEIPLP